MKESADILKEEYKKLRGDKSGSGSSYRFTVRQLESLIRLSEAMARLHCDDKIRPAYVTEVCRLLKASNINIVKSDIELEENQEAINVAIQQRNLEEQPQINQNGNDLFVSFKLLFNQTKTHLNALCTLVIRSRENRQPAQAESVTSAA